MLEALLDVQNLDNEIDQLDHRNAFLEERGQIDSLTEELSALAAAVASTEAQREELQRRQRALETDAGDLEQKAAGLDAKLYDGSVTSPKEATALGEEIAGLRERQSALEEQSIELLVEIEPLDEQIAKAGEARSDLESRVATLSATLETKSDEIGVARQAAVESRGAAAGQIDAELLGRYDKLRITFGPSGVVHFDAGKGGGCPVAMSAVELDRWKHLPAGTLEPCTDCGRLVAKTD